jgi:membrane protease YdiL (CAAX protease family)
MDGKIYPGIKNAVLLCLLFLGLQIGFGFVIGLLQVLLKLSDAEVFAGIAIGLGNLIAFGIVLLLGLRKTKRKFNEVFKFNAVPPLLWIAIIVFMVGFVMVTSELDNLVNYVLPMPEFLSDMFDTLMVKQAFILAVFIVGIIPGIMEELFFRGLILDGLVRNYTKRKAIIISALLFGIIHLNPWQFYSGFIVGLISAWICIRANSILLSIYIHFFNNALYILTVRYRDSVPIRGFNSNFATPVEFQPLWFDMLGAAILVAGILLLRKGLVHAKDGAQQA